MANEKFKIISLKRLSEVCKIHYLKLYHNLVSKKYASLDFNEKTQVSNALYEEVGPIFKELGFKIEIKRLNAGPKG